MASRVSISSCRRIFALVNFNGGFLHRALRAVQLGLCCGECVRSVLRRLFQRNVLTFQLPDFLNGSAVFALIGVKIRLGRNRRGIRFAQRILIVLIRLRGAGYFRFQLLLFVLRIRQALGVVVLPGIALLQLVTGLLERTLILTDRSQRCSDLLFTFSFSAIVSRVSPFFFISISNASAKESGKFLLYASSASISSSSFSLMRSSR